MSNLELIDCKKKGNLIRLYLGKNGKQRGDDWDDIPYEYNAGEVDHNFVDMILDMVIPFHYDILEPADDVKGNSPYCRNDFKDRKIYAFKIVPESYWEGGNGERMRIFFGDTLQNIVSNFETAKIDIHIVAVIDHRLG